MSITIKDVVNEVHEQHQELLLSKQDISGIIDTILATVGSNLLEGNDVVLRNFGRLYVKTKPPRIARNPRTGGTVDVPAKQVVKFAPRGLMKTSL